MSDETYLQVFIEEGREHVERMNTLLLQLESEPNNDACIQELFRSAHTLKGMSATMGFEQMAELTHELENVLQQVRDGLFQLTDETMDVFFQGIDRLERMMEQAAHGEEMASIDDLLAQLRGTEAVELSQSTHDLSFDEYERDVIRTAVQGDQRVYVVQVTVTEGCLLKGARAYMVHEALTEMGEVVKSVPSIEDLEAEQFDRTFQFVLLTTTDDMNVEKAVSQISELESVTVTKLAEDSLTHETGQAAAKTQTGQSNTSKPRVKMNHSIRVDIERLDALMNLFSEWIIDRGRLERIASEVQRPELTETIEHLSRIGGEMQDTLLNMRMVPVERVFNRFPRMLRDLAKELGKKVNFEMSGEETELDRTVIDEIGEPLVHLLRNALDHGLEAPEVRRKNGKDETGHLTLKAFHSGNHVFIEIADDGAGINREKVVQKAVANGVIDEDTAHTLEDQQVYDLLFASGFSTADEVTDVSGRGVGLDVVRTKIESLGGFVTVDSKAGNGTTFSIQLPLTLSILTALLVDVGGETYAIPLNSVLETGKFGKDAVQQVHGQPVLRFREQIVPLLSMHKVLDIPVPAASSDSDDEVFVVIVKKGEKLTGLIVDEFLGNQEVVLKSLGQYLTQVFAISGATILGDGRVALILDTNALVSQMEAVEVAV